MKIKFKYILVITVMVAVASCNRDQLAYPPETSISNTSAFDQPYRIANQVLSLYSTMKSGSFYGGRFLVYGDIRAEEFSLEDPNLVTNADVWQLNPTNSANAVVGLWAQAYLTINACN